MDDNTIICREDERLIDVVFSRSLVRDRLGKKVRIYRLGRDRALTVTSTPNTALINADFPAPDLWLWLTIDWTY